MFMIFLMADYETTEKYKGVISLGRCTYTGCVYKFMQKKTDGLDL